MEKWKPWENLELLKSAYHEPECEGIEDNDIIVCDIPVSHGDVPPGEIWGYRICNQDDED